MSVIVYPELAVGKVSPYIESLGTTEYTIPSSSLHYYKKGTGRKFVAPRTTEMYVKNGWYCRGWKIKQHVKRWREYPDGEIEVEVDRDEIQVSTSENDESMKDQNGVYTGFGADFYSELWRESGGIASDKQFEQVTFLGEAYTIWSHHYFGTLGIIADASGKIVGFESETSGRFYLAEDFWVNDYYHWPDDLTTNNN